MPKKMAMFLLVFHLFGLPIFASDPDPIQDYCTPNPKFGTGRTDRFSVLPCKNSSEVTSNYFIFSGMKKFAANFSKTRLAALSMNPTLFPGLNMLGMSFMRADLRVGDINPPYFHRRATTIAYLVRGSVYSGFVDSANRVFARVIEAGEVMVYPRGLVHFQMNVGDKPVTIFGSFNSQNARVQKILATIFGSGINSELLEKAFGLSTRQIGQMRRKFDPKTTR